jgi:hypothetical protein
VSSLKFDAQESPVTSNTAILSLVDWWRNLDGPVAVWDGSFERSAWDVRGRGYAVDAHQTMSPAVCAHTLNAHAQTASSDGWVVIVVLGGCFLAIAGLTAWLYKHDRPDDSGGDGGSGGPPPEPPPPDGPTWWPEFEREFAAYVAGKHENEKRPAPVGPGASPG